MDNACELSYLVKVQLTNTGLKSNLNSFADILTSLKIFFGLVDEKSVTDAEFQDCFLAHELVLRFIF